MLQSKSEPYLKREAERFHCPELHAEIVVLLFWHAHDHWFDEPENAFFGRKEHCHAYIAKWLDDGALPKPQSDGEYYLAMKFEEWLEEWEPIT
jgi:hypothetical protein